MSCARRGTVDPEQALDRERPGVLLVHRRDVVEPVEIGHVLKVGARLHQLFGAAMEEADMRIDALDDLAVEFEHEPQHAVGGRMLRSEVDREVAEVLVGHGRLARLLVAGQRRALPGAQEVELTEFLAQAHRLVAHALLLVVVAHFDEAGHREVLAKRMAFETVVGEDAAKVGVAGEQHAEKVVGLALVPVGAGPHRTARSRPASPRRSRP